MTKRHTAKKFMPIILAIAIAALTLPGGLFSPVNAKAADSPDTSWHNGTDSSFAITTASQLAGLAQLVNDGTDDFENKTINLTANIDLGGADLTPIGNSSYPFNGIFNGGAHYIANFAIDTGSNGYAGLFGRIGSSGVVQNVGVIGGTVSGGDYTGGIAGSNEGSIELCYNANDISGGVNVGGIAGRNTGEIISSYNTGDISGSNNVGGLAGQNDGTGKIDGCYSTAILTSPNATHKAGLVGYNNSTTTTVSYCSFYRGPDSPYYFSVNNTTGTITDAKRLTIAEMTDAGTLTDSAKMQGLNTATPGAFVKGSHSAPISGCQELYYPELAIFANSTDPNSVAMSKLSVTTHLCSPGADEEPFTEGLGTVDTPYEISTAEQLNHVRQHMTAYLDLTKDIDLSAFSNWSPIGSSSSNAFTGTLDGGDNTITNLTINLSTTDYVGLFGYIGSGGTVKDLTLYAGSSVKGRNHVGGIAGWISSGTLTGCENHGGVEGTGGNVGGIVGNSNNSTIDYCRNKGNVEGTSPVGGIAGAISGGRLTDCVNTGSVTGTNYVGGIAGNNTSGTIDACLNEGEIKGNLSWVGGIVGLNTGAAINNCHNTGKVTGASSGNYTGGIAGSSTTSPAVISNCYNTGEIHGNNNVGGVAGSTSNSEINSSYNTGKVSGNSSLGGVLGNQSGASSMVTDCYNTGDVSGSSSTIGGVTGGHGGGSLTNCYNAGNISGTTSIGGIAGSGYGAISYCYNIGNVTCTNTTGIVRGGSVVGITSSTPAIDNCFRYEFVTVNGSVTTPATTANSVAGEALTLAELHDENTFKVWLDAGVWKWDQTDNFPKLNLGSETTPFASIHTITYNLNGGDLTDIWIEYVSGAVFTLPTPQSTDSDQIFTGWFDNPSFTGPRVAEIAAGESGNKTYWAKWEPKAQPSLTLSADPQDSQTYPGNIVLTAELSDLFDNYPESDKTVKFTITATVGVSTTTTTYDVETDEYGTAVYTLTSPDSGTYTFEADFAGDEQNKEADTAQLEDYIVYMNQSGFEISDPGEKTYGDNDFVLSASGGQTDGVVEYSVPVDNGVLTVTSEGEAEIVGAGSVTVTAVKEGEGTYNQAISTREITVLPRDIANVTITVERGGTPKQPSFTVSDGAINITENDYTVAYGARGKTGSITLTGIGNYMGTKTENFTIMGYLADEDEVLEIVVDGVSIPYNSDGQGNVSVTPTVDQIQSMIDNASGDTITFDFSSIEDINSLTFSLEPEWFDGAGKSVTFLFNGYSLTLSDGMLQELIDKFGGLVVFDIEIGSVTLSVTQDGKQIDWYNYNHPMTVSMPFEGNDDDDDDYVIIRDEVSGNVIARCWYDSANGIAYAKVYRAGTYQAEIVTAVQFADTQGQWMDPAVRYAAARGIIKGTGGNLFSPEREVTRAEFLTMLIRTLNPEIPAIDDNAPFTDVAESAYYYNAVAVAKALGIVNGVGGGRFNPDSAITRQDMFTILYNAMKATNMLPAVMTQQWVEFVDWDDVADYASVPIQTLAALGLVNGNGNGVLEPRGTATRAHSAQIICNLVQFDSKLN